MTGILNILAGALGVAKDTYFNLVSLLLPGNGTDGANNNMFLDSSANNFPITRNPTSGPNAPTQGTFSPFSQTGWGNYFDGSGDRLSVADNVALRFGTGDFTIEFWWYLTESRLARPIQTGSNQTGTFGVITYTNNTFDFVQASTASFASPIAYQPNTWQHVVFVRSGTTLSCFVNGSRLATTTNSYDFNATQSLLIGYNDVNTSQALIGYLSQVRLVKGTAVYDPTQTTLTVPTAPLTAISGTSLLTCQSNRFKDNSSNDFTITPAGNVSVTPFSPFAPTQPYSASAVGGSGYFDGVNDSLQIADATALDLGLGNFTIETWIYVSGGSGTFRQFFSKYTGGVGIEWYVNSSNKLEVYFNGGAGQITSTGTINTNTWYHVVLVRSGTGAGQTKFYINGTEDGSSQANVNVDNAGALYIGESGGGSNDFLGYVSNLRIIKGTAVYTGAFTPPTKPLAASGADSAGSYPSTTNVDTSFASSACSLLLNFTNAGVVDATAKNVLETVGNAQISTTGAGGGKWGGGSIYFDGTDDYLALPNSNLLAFGGGDFTCEFWMYHTASGGVYAFIFGSNAPSTATGWFAVRFEGAYGLLGFAANNAAVLTASSTLSANTWHHVALVRNGSGSNNLKWYLNGTASGQTTYTTNIGSGATSNYLVGADATNLRWFGGYIQGLRITKGVARYVEGTGANAGKMVFNGTNTLALPTAPFPVQ